MRERSFWEKIELIFGSVIIITGENIYCTSITLISFVSV